MPFQAARHANSVELLSLHTASPVVSYFDTSKEATEAAELLKQIVQGMAWNTNLLRYLCDINVAMLSFSVLIIAQFLNIQKFKNCFECHCQCKVLDII